MMNADELPYVLQQVNISKVRGEVLFKDSKGELKVVDYVYVDQSGDLIFCKYEDKDI
jgi:hypothetical protein